jgi:cytochrome c5
VTFNFNFSMTSRFFLAVALGTAAWLGGCASPTRAVSPAEAQWAAKEWPGTTAQDLEAGRSLFRAKCSMCHALPLPNTKTPADWDATVLGEMGARAHLSMSDRNLIAHYLGAASSKKTATGG